MIGTVARIGVSTPEDIRQTELRRIHPMPDLIARLMCRPRYVAAFNDRYGFRKPLLALNARLSLNCLNESPTPAVTVGRDGWLFYCDEISYYRGVRPLTTVELNEYAHRLESRRKWLASRGCRYLLVVAPNKSSIYPEQLPPMLGRGGVRRLDQLAQYLKANTSVSLLDLRPALTQAKARGQLFYKTDTHWNDLGACVAAEQIDAAIRPWYKDVRFPSAIQYRHQPIDVDGDLRRMMFAKDLISETAYRLSPVVPTTAHRVNDYLQTYGDRSHDLFATQSSNTALPRLVMFRDSFTIALQPYLSERYGRAVFCYGRDTNAFDDKLIAIERPSLVIQEVVERNL